MTAARYAAFLRNVNLGRANSPTRLQFEAAFLESGASSAESFLVNGTLVFTLAPGARPRAVAARACEAMRVACGMAEPVFVRSLDELQRLVASDPFGSERVPGLASCAVGVLANGDEVARRMQDQAPLQEVAVRRGAAPLQEVAARRGAAPLQEVAVRRGVAPLQEVAAVPGAASLREEASSAGADTCCISFLGAPRKAMPALPFTTARGDLALLCSQDTHVLSISRWVGRSAGSPNAWLERTLGEPATTRHWRTVVRLVEKYS